VARCALREVGSALRLASDAWRLHLDSMTLLQKRDVARRQRRLDVLAETRRCLQSALRELIPGQRVIVFGSLTKPGVFNDRSDVDLALETEPAQMSLERLVSELMERLNRPVDVLLLNRCRFRGKILREGEAWTA
jgi:predicted nucleotidyltransferase